MRRATKIPCRRPIGEEAIDNLDLLPSPAWGREGTISPANSCPIVTGGQQGNWSCQMRISVPQIPQAFASINTSPYTKTSSTRLAAPALQYSKQSFIPVPRRASGKVADPRTGGLMRHPRKMPDTLSPRERLGHQNSWAGALRHVPGWCTARGNRGLRRAASGWPRHRLSLVRSQDQNSECAQGGRRRWPSVQG